MSTSSTASCHLRSKIRAHPARSRRLTEDERAEIIEYALQSPESTYQAIADKFQTSSSTVGKVIRAGRASRRSAPATDALSTPVYLELPPEPDFGQLLPPTFAEARHCICHLIPVEMREKIAGYGSLDVQNGAGGEGLDGAMALPRSGYFATGVRPPAQ